MRLLICFAAFVGTFAQAEPSSTNIDDHLPDSTGEVVLPLVSDEQDKLELSGPGGFTEKRQATAEDCPELYQIYNHYVTRHRLIVNEDLPHPHEEASTLEKIKGKIAYYQRVVSRLSCPQLASDTTATVGLEAN